MELLVTDAALAWFRADWGFQSGDTVRVFVRYGGAGGFSIGLRKEPLRDVGLSAMVGGITFFIKDEDVWYLEDRNLSIDYDAMADDIIYHLG